MHGIDLGPQQVSQPFKRSPGCNSFLHCLQEKVSWLLQQPTQLATTVHQITWCQTVEAALAQQQAKLNLSRCLDNMQLQLAELSRAARGRLTPLERAALVSMITLDVHMRDVTENLLR